MSGRSWAMTVLFLASAGCAAQTPIAATPGATSGETYRYCAGTVTEWEEHHCIWELNPEQQRRRSYSQRLTYSGGRVVRYEEITGSGGLIEGEESSSYHYEGGRIVGWTEANRNGVVKARKIVSPDRRFVFWLDAVGRPRPKKDSKASGLKRELDDRGRVLSYAYVDAAGTPTTYRNVHLVRAARNEQGAIVDERFFGVGGEPVADMSGAHHVVHTVDARGCDLALRYYDVRDQPTLADGVHLVRTEWNDVGNRMRSDYFDVGGRPVLSEKEGAASIRFVRDAHGNETRRELLDESGRLVVGADHFAIRERRFDERDLPIEWAFFGPDGAPLALRDRGDALLRETRDARANIVLDGFFDEHGRPVLVKDGYHAVKTEYDARDNPVSYSYLGVDDAPVVIKNGYHRRRHTYDGDRITRTAYFDASGTPVNAFGRYAVTEIRYAADGTEAAKRSFDTSGAEVTTCAGKVTKPLENEITSRAKSVTRCYKDLLGTQPKAAGRLVLELRFENVDGAGKVGGTGWVEDTIHDEAFDRCIASELSRPYANAPEGGCVFVRVPFVFQPTTTP